MPGQAMLHDLMHMVVDVVLVSLCLGWIFFLCVLNVLLYLPRPVHGAKLVPSTATHTSHIGSERRCHAGTGQGPHTVVRAPHTLASLDPVLQ